ncbi:DUF6443 domain-containing protein [Flagellimonas pacifica]|uniref:RHS repeat-associated core domain-containing protein n=1 Tax=Flagellimonas pacifica TaxID=1247520 RepID=A0A285MXJ5_9FLAO|nr:DUF6443 domain-containing protein [Allomuricauda parva]SNZ01919.1 RHS repeat-associated core domain-containing protein [Allomuricauda parva]
MKYAYTLAMVFGILQVGLAEEGPCFEVNPEYTQWFKDVDGDGYGKKAVYICALTKPVGYVSVYGDCDDTDNTIYPGASELCDGKDNNCDNSIDEDPLPEIPPTPSTTNNCGNTVLTRGTPPFGITWYWQSSASGTNTFNSSTTLTRTSGTVYYLRGRRHATNCWGPARSVNYTVNGVPATPTMPTITKNCGNTVLIRGAPPAGITWYWQGTGSGTSTSNPSNSVTRTSGTIYYLRARNNSTGCWGPSRSINYTIEQPITWYLDSDGDGHAVDSQPSCGSPGTGWSDQPMPIDDCNDGAYSLENDCYVPSDPINQNYVYTRTYQKNASEMLANAQDQDNFPFFTQSDAVLQEITFFDGLGRPVQQVEMDRTPKDADDNTFDMITHTEYDAYGRTEKEWLPYADMDPEAPMGSYRTTAGESTNAYYVQHYGQEILADAPNPHSQTEFESSPLNRVLKQAAPGHDWRLGGGHEISFGHMANTANEVKRYKVETSFANNTYMPSLGDDGHYAQNQLYKNITKDENHTGGNEHTTVEFTDKQGRTVLKRTYAPVGLPSEVEAHDTYYVYDDYGNLTYVLPPKMEAGTAPFTNIMDNMDELGYQYVYDHRNRLVEKKVPGKGWEYIVYNNLDQPVLTQDALLRPNKWWLFTKYDAFGRVAYTGMYANGTVIGRSAMQEALDAHYKGNSPPRPYEEKQDNAGSYHYYTNNSFPKSGLDVLTVNYYDNYLFNKDGGTDPQSVYGTPTAQNVKGRPTGSKVKVLGTPNWITTVTYYDAKGRAMYTRSRNNYLKVTDVVENKLDFVGKVLESRTTHTKDSNPSIIVTDNFTYDHVGRPLKQEQTLGGNTETIVENSYDALGQLTSKEVGGGLQTVDYQYNVRGWLKSINDPDDLGNDLFTFKINYNAAEHGTTPLYNGNIAETEWRTANTDNSLKWYTYGYDALNRITGATDNTGNYNLSNVVYDKNGNIRQLHRTGHTNLNATVFGNMDQLAYTYNKGNKLLKVKDNGSNQGFRDGADTTKEYAYDANGNMTSDRNKGITAITYNHLNLPTKVTMGGGTISYIYDAMGTKLKKKVGATGPIMEYAGNYTYENGQLQFFNTSEGYATPDGNGGYDYVYQYKDHLGNVRLSYADNNGTLEIVEENNYYPFGLKHQGYNSNVSSLGNSVAQRFKFGGKEFDESLGLETYDFGARNYNPDLGRWMNLDPLAEGMRRFSPYNYAWDNPIVYVDPDGMFGKYFDGDGNLVYEDGVDDNKVYQVESSVKTNEDGTASLNVEITDLGVESDLVNTNGKTISSEETNNDLVGLAIYTRNNVEGAEDAVVNVTSGDRSTKKNKSVGGSSGSRHISGDAADITISGLSNEDAAMASADSGLFSTVIYYPEKGDTSGFGSKTRTMVSGMGIQTKGDRIGPAPTSYTTIKVTNEQTLNPHVHVDNRPRSGGTKKLRYTGHNGKRNTYKNWKSKRRIQ